MRFHLHPSIKATRLTDGHGVMLMTPNKEVWTFSAHDDRVELEDSVYLAGTEGPRRTSQMVIRGHAGATPRVLWTFQQTTSAALATAGTGRRVARRGAAAAVVNSRLPDSCATRVAQRAASQRIPLRGVR